MKPNRIYIIGTGGAGKSHLADFISDKYAIPHYHLDDIFWFNKYTKARNEKYRLRKLKEIAKKKKWIIEGAYTSWVSDGIRKAEIIIFLFPNEFLMAWRVLLRFIKGKLSMNPSKERFKDLLNVIPAILGYRIIKKQGTNKTRYERHKELIEKHKVDFILIRTKKELKEFINNLD